MIRNIFLLLRPHQWVKNTFCFLPLFFDRHVMDIEYLIPCAIAFLSFCFAASGIYCFNADVLRSYWYQRLRKEIPQ